MLLSLFTIELFDSLQLKCVKLAVDWLHLFSVIYLSAKIVVFTICLTILSFLDLLLKMYFMRPKSYLMYVYITFYLGISSYLRTITQFRAFKNGLKNGNLRTAHTNFGKQTLVESVLYKKLKLSQKMKFKSALL